MDLPFISRWKNEPPAIRVAKGIRLFSVLGIVVTILIVLPAYTSVQNKLNTLKPLQASVVSHRKVTEEKSKFEGGGVRRYFYLTIRTEEPGQPTVSREMSVSESTYEHFQYADAQVPQPCRILHDGGSHSDWFIEWTLERDRESYVQIAAILLTMLSALAIFMSWEIRKARKKLSVTSAVGAGH